MMFSDASHQLLQWSINIGYWPAADEIKLVALSRGTCGWLLELTRKNRYRWNSRIKEGIAKLKESARAGTKVCDANGKLHTIPASIVNSMDDEEE